MVSDSSRTDRSDDPYEGRLLQAFTVRWLVLGLGLAVTYAAVRYHVFGGVEWANFPLFIANKAISLAAVFFVAASYLIGKLIRVYDDEADQRLVLVKFCGLIGFSLAAIHALMAMLLLSPAYYPKFFGEGGRLNLTGELSMVFGVLALWCLALPALTSLPFMHDAIGTRRWLRGQRMGHLSLALVAGHVFVMGWSGWLSPGAWPGGLPSISLVAFIGAMVPVLVKLWSVSAGPGGE